MAGDDITGSEVGPNGTVDEPVVVEVQAGQDGTIVVFDLETAQVVASIMTGWRVIAPPTPQAAVTASGALITSWFTFFNSSGPWVLVPPADPTIDRPAYKLIDAWLKDAKGFQVTDVRMCVTIGSPIEWVTSRPPEMVRKFLEGAAPAKLPARAPSARGSVRAKRSLSSIPILDVDHSCVRAPDEIDENGQRVPGALLMSGACPIVKSVETSVNDFVPGQRAITQFRLAMVLPDGREVRISDLVPLYELSHINKWLAWAEVPRAATLSIDPKPMTGSLIASAIQAAAADAEMVEVRPRTGFLELNGRAYYLTTTGGLTKDGLSPDCRADIDYPLDFSAGLDGDPVAAWRKAISLRSRFIDPTPYLATIAFGAGVIAGAPPQGSLALVGGPSAGKTTLLRTALAIFGGISSTWAGTELARGALLSGCHQAVGLVDDVPPKTSEREQAKQLAALDQLLRRGYDPKSGYIRLQLAETRPSGTRLAPQDLSAPGICISLEAVPSGLSPSARERMLVWEVQKDTTWREDGWEMTKADWLSTDTPITAGAHLVMSILGSVEAYGGVQRWLDKIRTASASTKVGQQILASVDTRLRDKLYPYWVGLDVLMAAWENMGVPGNEIEDWGYQVQEALENWSRGTRAADQSDNWGDRILELIHAAKFSGKAVIASHDSVVPPGSIRIGAVTPKGVALLPELVAQAIDLSIETVRQGLRSICGPARPQRFGDQTSRAYIVPDEKWWPEGRPEPQDNDW